MFFKVIKCGFLLRNFIIFIFYFEIKKYIKNIENNDYYICGLLFY